MIKIEQVYRTYASGIENFWWGGLQNEKHKQTWCIWETKDYVKCSWLWRSEDMWEIISKYNFRVLIFQGTTSGDDVTVWVLQQIQKLDAYEKPKASQCALKGVKCWRFWRLEDMWEIINKCNFGVLIFQGTTLRDNVMISKKLLMKK